MHWLDTYPHVVCASVLLLDGKIESWKVGQHKWNAPFDAKTGWKMDRIGDYKTATTEWTVNTSAEHQAAFEKLAPEWFRQWKIADDLWGSKPYGDEGCVEMDCATGTKDGEHK